MILQKKIQFALIFIVVVSGFKESTDNKYLILSTSKFWFNMRQSVNALMIYQSLRDIGIQDENILLLIPENTACNSKNNQPGIVCPFDDTKFPNIYRNVEIDYKQNDVRIQTWTNILRGRYGQYTPYSRRLKLNHFSRFISYASGHGGDGYMKFQDTSYLLDFEMAKLIKEMEQLQLFKEAYFIADSCSAITLYEKIQTNNTLSLGSSSANQKSYSRGKDKNLLMSKSDKFSFTNYQYLNNQFRSNPKSTLADLIKEYDPIQMKCDAKLINRLDRNETQIPLNTIFQGQQSINQVQILNFNGNSGISQAQTQIKNNIAKLINTERNFPKLFDQRQPIENFKQPSILNIM